MKPESRSPSRHAGRELSPDRPLVSPGDGLYRPRLESLPGMVYIARTDAERTVEWTDAGGQGLLGHAVGEPFALAPLVHPEDLEQVLALVRTAVAEHRPFSVEYRLRHADGAWRTVWEQGQPVREGARTLVHGWLLDVTRRLEVERGRLLAELRVLQLQKLNAINHLAAGVAHEFNNLVAGILGSAELLAMDLPDGHAGTESLKHIFEASNHARDFVQRLRIFGQRPVPEFALLPLQPLVEETLQILRTIIPAKVELHGRLSADCPPVYADSAQLHQALLDLCLFCWQTLADRRGTINVELENSPAPALPAGATALLPGDYVRLSVQDDSPGTDKISQEMLFHPFRMRRAGGTKVGLELFGMRETIRLHQGDVLFHSQPGHGQRFDIYLPVPGEK